MRRPDRAGACPGRLDRGRPRHGLAIVGATAALALYTGVVQAGFKADIGYQRLRAELGPDLPDGSGIRVVQVEAAKGTDRPDAGTDPDPAPAYAPDPALRQFAGKTLSDRSSPDSGPYSTHASSVGRYFYGNKGSIAPGIRLVDIYLADHWLGAGYLRADGPELPLSSPARVANHSWVARLPDRAVNAAILRRVDWVVDTDEFIQAVGIRNGNGPNKPLLSSAFNVIAVGRSDGQHGTGTPRLDAAYVGGRTRPHLVVPMATSSAATPVLASAAALLVMAGHTHPAWSTDPVVRSTRNRYGDRIYNAERSEVIKAALMAGADRRVHNGSRGDIADWRAEPAYRSGNGLDTRYGAGQLNLYNSYRILAAGEQNSDSDAGPAAGPVRAFGFDYDPAFGGAAGSNRVADYELPVSEHATTLSAALVWNTAIPDRGEPPFSMNPVRHHLELRIYDTSGPLLLLTSADPDENTQNIHLPLLPGHGYRLQVATSPDAAAFTWDYALAWQLQAGDSTQLTDSR